MEIYLQVRCARFSDGLSGRAIARTFGTERLTGALLDRLTHHVSILEMNGDSYRLAPSKARIVKAKQS